MAKRENEGEMKLSIHNYFFIHTLSSLLAQFYETPGMERWTDVDLMITLSTWIKRQRQTQDEMKTKEA